MTVTMRRTGINVDRKVEAEDDLFWALPVLSALPAMIAVLLMEGAESTRSIV
jgi:hypothetical protein